MKLLLDTHVVLWWCADSRRLKAAVRKAIASADLVWVSAASGWEVAIKQSVGKLTLDEPFSTLVRQSDFDELPVTLDHAERFRTLPPHHTDLFDRMLIAQAKAEAVTIVTHDRQFESYQVPILWV